jgi:hypothetical protein
VPNVPSALKSFWTQPMVLLDDWGHVESHLFLFGDSVVSVQDRCTACAKCTIGSKNCFGHTQQYSEVMRLKSKLGLFGDSANLVSREVHRMRQTYIGSEIILYAPDGTPR